MPGGYYEIIESRAVDELRSPPENSGTVVAMPRIIGPDPSGLPHIISRHAAHEAGITDAQIQARLRAGRWVTLAPGQYLRVDPDSVESFDQHHAQLRTHYALAAIAAARRISDSAVAFGSAAMVHNLGLASGVPDRCELVVPHGRWNGVRGKVRVRLAEVDVCDVVEVSGVAVTSPSRTWVDVARTSSLADALACGDSALRSNLADDDSLSEALRRHPSSHGIKRANKALALVNAARENPLESRSFACFVEWQIPLPECQVDIYDDEGFVARVDFLWRNVAIVGEADGRLKYTDPTVLYAEKRREDRLRALGFIVVRWGWSDLNVGVGLRARLEALLHTAA